VAAQATKAAARQASTNAQQEAPLEVLRASLLKPALDYAVMHGLVYADKNLAGDISRATQCPVALLPGKVPVQAFQDVVELAPLWNKLVDAIARDREWLYRTLEHAGQADPFTGRLVAMSKQVHQEGLRQRMFLGIHRSDYMLHEPTGEAVAPRFLQVELNTIASSMGAHAANTTSLHKFLLSRYGQGTGSIATALKQHFSEATVFGGDLVDALPGNPALSAIPHALAAAHRVYGAKDAAILFVVQGDERNYADQRGLEYRLWQDHQVPVLRKTLRQVKEEGGFDASSGRLLLDHTEISVVYYRAGYTPDDYFSEMEWEGRLLLERSRAIKSPSVDYQLVGAKKVQQAIAKPGAVERFLLESEGAKLRGSFAGLWGLGPGEDDADIIQKVMASPDGFVLKPQREGGGNNFYGPDAAAQLRKMSVEERGAWILMQRIEPKPQPCILTREGIAEVAEGVSEYGFYSTFLGDGAKIHLSEHAGHLVRTKKDGVNEGGVAVGCAVISSPFLTA